MKKLIVLLMGFVPLIACTGDCLTCHPKLLPTIEEDCRHKPMLGCIECHSANPNSMAECGSDCFSCHPVEKIEKVPVKAHSVIRDCRDCHVQLKEVLCKPEPERQQSFQKPLKEFLLQ